MKNSCYLCGKDFERDLSFVKRSFVESGDKKIFLSTVTKTENDDNASVCDECLEELMIRVVSEE